VQAAGLALWLLLFGLSDPAAAALVQLGVDTLEAQNFSGLQGLRVGLVTNPTGVDSKGVSTIQVLRQAPGVHLVALFGPEHGLDGKVKAGEPVAHATDPATGLPVYSLYGATRKPLPQMLRGIDVMVYDVQDIGVRSYTFISTLGLVMQAAAEAGIKVAVLDRPDPLGGLRIEGGGVDATWRSFVGQYDIPYVYGMTPGEMACWINGHWLAKPCKLQVYKMTGWKRNMIWEDTGLRWIPTSPNIPRAKCSEGYVATGLLGEIGITNGANVSSNPFEVVADTMINPGVLAQRFNALGFAGLSATALSFFPSSGNYTRVQFHGMRLLIDSRRSANLFAVNFQILDLLRQLYPARNYMGKASRDSIVMFDKLNGGSQNRLLWQSGRSAQDLMATWKAREQSWRQERQPYLLY